MLTRHEPKYSDSVLWLNDNLHDYAPKEPTLYVSALGRVLHGTIKGFDVYIVITPEGGKHSFLSKSAAIHKLKENAFRVIGWTNGH